MLSSLSKLMLVGALMISAMLLTACTTSGRAPVNYKQLGSIVDPLPGAMGKTRVDQRKIDQVIAAGCSGKIIQPNKCDEHSKASATRKSEF